MNSENLSTLLLEGINLIFEKWTVLRLAVTNNWGGTSSEEKKKKLIEYVHNYVLSNTTPKDKLCDYLRDEVNTLFNVDIDDDSDIEVSDLILDLYKDLKNNNLEIIEKIRNIQEHDLNSCREHNLIQEVDIDEEDDSASEYSDEDNSNEAYSDSYQSEGM
ncbi:pre-rRNA-processing protein TSR2, putative [Plasmodium berghei]|uniref:Pre-rRNA-processing protein TSR2, putative n=2 Tax=Plasmodium berghei TaxID=5821 RepID=A0A509AGM2_PLABA|nr:pre-rRNA-processing protein TSR2, putative [Plasmodium berghei ANKA]CXH87499.1 pre-rRNA-processing protein TSR2, putative [Plasmodium berghei]SCL90102.1 pre-rRNA-processing protein TSR2, putative [Plasmodium berghei]SCM15219.1 pre-rRNA-processing protein TSR2, putative [Plasmodium berghei]SCM17014.1 pre-rRNA-processing protein TSR2, putative [Plasmodium berghei]SCN21869.1 pre-rRNA-processing protein TSR2, putative [Plasmodium berghei]|eukprot:XP_034419795.1 pre-rRNA-processing protein TSR2, putative [Plasmodium berghei ANKA]